LQYTDFASFPQTGVSDNLYIDLNDSNKQYIWNGSAYETTGGGGVDPQAPTQNNKTVGLSNTKPDYVINGVNDQIVINQALVDVANAGGGTVELLSEANITNTILIPSLVTLKGALEKTKINIPNTFDPSLITASQLRPIITNLNHVNGNIKPRVENIYINANATGRLTNNGTWLTNNRPTIHFEKCTSPQTVNCVVLDSISEGIKNRDCLYPLAENNIVDSTRYIVGGAVFGVRVTNFGSGYTTATVNITGGGGTGATATASIVGGLIFSITITNAGSGYTSLPTISITGDGTGASAIALGLGGMAGIIASSTGTPGVSLTSFGARFVNNTVFDTGGEGIGCYNARGVVISNNTIKKTNSDSATTIHTEYCQGVIVSDNTLETTTYSGLSALNSKNINFVGNIIGNSGQFGAIVHGASENISFANNVFRNCQQNGVHVKDSVQGLTLVSNQFTNNSLQGAGLFSDILLIPSGDSHRRITMSNNVHDHPNSSVKTWLETFTTASTINGLTVSNIGCYRNTPDRIIDVFNNVLNQVFTGIVTSQGQNTEIPELTVGAYARMRKRSTQTASTLFTNYAGFDFVAPLTDGNIDIGARSNINVYIDKNNTSGEIGELNIYGNGNTNKLLSIKDDGIVSTYLLPVYANNPDALAGGLVVGDLYKTATGEVRVVV
jgi:hypothetical protein